MKLILKVLKWTGIIIAGIAIIFVALVFILDNRKYHAPFPDIHASTDSSVIARGRYLAYGPAHCSGCHSPEENATRIMNGEQLPLEGGYVFKLPVGKIYSRNITPDNETGIGNVPDSVIARSLRYGVDRDGYAIFDFMPFHNLSDEDLTAVISFLRSQKPISRKVSGNNFNFLGRIAVAFLIKPVGPSGPVQKVMKPDTSAAYGGYLTSYVANCRGCHTNRNLMTGAYTGPFFAGGLKFETADTGVYTVTPNLTPDKQTGRITTWSQQQFIDRFRQPRVIDISEMPWEQFRGITDNDLKAIYKYLMSLPPVNHYTGPTYVNHKTARK